MAGAVDEVLDGTLDRAFCAVRPPGHHATRERSMGFCLFNNMAVGAARALDEVGEGEGRGFTVNLPMPGGLGDAEYARAWRGIVEPIGREFDPELVLISAGFDAHEDDPLGGMALTGAGYADLANVCVSMASGSAKGRVVAVLEGGYSLHGLAEGAGALAGRLLDGPGEGLDPADDARTEALLEAWRQAQAPFWPVVR